MLCRPDAAFATSIENINADDADESSHTAYEQQPTELAFGKGLIEHKSQYTMYGRAGQLKLMQAWCVLVNIEDDTIRIEL